MIILGERVTCQIDSGATVNVISAKYIKETPLFPTSTKLRMYDGTIITPKGKATLRVVNPKTQKKFDVRFVVVSNSLTPLLGKKTSEKMGLITVNYNEFDSVDNVNSKSESATSTKVPLPTILPTNDLFKTFSEVFDDRQGNLPGVVHLEVDPTVPPVTSPSGRVPLAMEAKVKEELSRLTEKDIITPVEQPTDWTSRMVIATKKSGDLRICIDP